MANSMCLSLCHSYANTERNSLQHHGVLGMKWGIRRYQNEDGTYTSAGKKRYGMGEGTKVKAKHIKNFLNDTEEEVSTNVAQINNAKRQQKIASKRFNKAVEKGDTKKAEKYKKIEEANKQIEEVARKKVEELESTQWKAIAAALESGFNVKIKDTMHDVSPKSVRLLRGLLAPLGGAVGGALYGAVNAAEGNYVQANKFKVSNAKPGEQGKLISKKRQSIHT